MAQQAGGMAGVNPTYNALKRELDEEQRAVSDSLDAQARRVFDQVIDRAGAERAEHLDRACAAAPALRVRVEALLAAAEKDDCFLSEPTRDVGAARGSRLAGERPGDTIGPYTLIELIGEGGFGSVFRAEQSAPVRRSVALKIIKAGMDTKQVITRFEAERQMLALMEHPSIARIYDAGATESGRPYFAMELVHGQPVTQYCDDARLSLTQRLELFRDICGAVQHAHQKGVIHRDLKPSNVLASTQDNRPFCKIIDFGIAKATQPRLWEQTSVTDAHQFIGTPDYMSPEQAGGADIDTRSDLYSLGVLFYELLTGTTPFDRRRLREGGYDGLRQILSREEPPRPSHRLQMLVGSSARFRLETPANTVTAEAPSSLVTDIAKGRKLEPTALTRALRGDLDWIVMKCLEKDRDRRYPTASALADDIGRYLRHQPVSATPPSAGYQLRKFVRRNRGAVVAGVIVTSSLLTATGVSFAFALSEARQRKAAEHDRGRAQKAEGDARKRSEDLQKVAEFQDKQLSGIDAQAMGVKLRADLLERARAAAERSKLSPNDVDTRAVELERLIAGADFTGLAMEALDNNFFQPALDAIRKQFADQPLVKARLLQTLASTLHELGLLDAATVPQEEALAIRRHELGDEHPDTLKSIHDLGVLLQVQGKLSAAAPYCHEALEKHRRVLGNEHIETLTAINDMGFFLQAQGKMSEAEQHYREALDARRRILGDDHPDTLTSINSMGFLLHAQDRLVEAAPYYREALETRRRVLGDDHPETLKSINNLGGLLKDQGQLADAELLYHEALEKRRRVLGEDHPETIGSINNMGWLFEAQGRLAEAEPHYRQAVEKRSRVLGMEHPETLVSVGNLSSLLGAQGRPSEAVALLASAEPAVRRVFAGDNAVRLGRFLILLGRQRVAAGEFAAAEANLTEAHAILGEARGATDQHRAGVLAGMVELYEAWHAAEPDQGYDAKAAEQRRKLEEWQADKQKVG